MREFSFMTKLIKLLVGGLVGVVGMVIVEEVQMMVGMVVVSFCLYSNIYTLILDPNH